MPGFSFGLARLGRRSGSHQREALALAGRQDASRLRLAGMAALVLTHELRAPAERGGWMDGWMCGSAAVGPALSSMPVSGSQSAPWVVGSPVPPGWAVPITPATIGMERKSRNGNNVVGPSSATSLPWCLGPAVSAQQAVVSVALCFIHEKCRKLVAGPMALISGVVLWLSTTAASHLALPGRPLQGSLLLRSHGTTGGGKFEANGCDAVPRLP